MTVEVVQKHFPLWKREIISPHTSQAVKIFPVLFTCIIFFFSSTLLGISITFSSQHFSLLLNAPCTVMDAMLEESSAQTNCSMTQIAQ